MRNSRYNGLASVKLAIRYSFLLCMGTEAIDYNSLSDSPFQSHSILSISSAVLYGIKLFPPVSSLPFHKLSSPIQCPFDHISYHCRPSLLRSSIQALCEKMNEELSSNNLPVTSEEIDTSTTTGEKNKNAPHLSEPQRLCLQVPKSQPPIG